MILTEIQELPAYFSQEGLRLEIILNQLIKNSLTVQETLVLFLGWEVLLEKG